MKHYNNYHKHDYYGNIKSLDVVVSPLEYIQRAKELDGDKAIFFSTNHGYQGNIYEYYTLCKEHGVKLIAGVEAYYVPDRFEKDRRNYHLIIIAKNKNGYKQINSIMSEANTTGFYYKPRVDDELIFKLNPNDVIITTACIASRLRDIEGAEDWIIKMKEYFKNNFYLEVQNHNVESQKEYNKRLLEYSKKYNIPIIHANDSHYIYEKDSKYRDLFLKAKGITYGEEDSFILDYPNYETILKRYENQGILTREQAKTALDNTLIFDSLEGIEFDYEIKMPHISDNPSKELGDIIKKEFEKEIKEKHINIKRKEEYIQAIKEEWKVIEETKMHEYFLINYKMVHLAVNKYNGIITKSSRGSAPSFYINKLLGFTSLDRLSSPITLYPSRFMSTTRILQSKSLPDIDTNVAFQQPFIDASKELLGEDNCQWMVSFKPLQDASAFRLYCKAIDMEVEEYDEIAKNLDDYRENKEWKDIIEESKHFVGVVEAIAQSPCSTLLLSEPISQKVGLLKVGDVICCNIDGINCDRYKFLKNDILAVSVYKIIYKVCELIGIDIPSTQELTNLLDEKTWDIYEKGLTCTINQADSEYGTGLAKRYKPKSIAEMSAFVAAIRPGFAPLLNDFIDRKPYTTGVIELDNLLKDSYHRLMYQESIMKYLIWLGIDESETYTIIKKISKKKFKEKELEELKSKLKEGWLNVVGKEEGFEATWEVVQASAKYSFNASHSLSYAYDSLYGAYLKSHYPLEYYTVVLNQYESDKSRTSRLIDECKQFGIKLQSPKFGYSKAEYFFNKETKTIYKGVGSIKYLNEQKANILYELSQSKNYETFTDILYDAKEIDNRCLEILIKLGYFSEFGCISKLLKVFELYKNKGNKKTMSKTKDIELYMTYKELAERNATKETAKVLTMDYHSFIRDIELSLEDVEDDIIELIRNEIEYTGGFNKVAYKQMDKNACFISDLKVFRYDVLIELFCFYSGNVKVFKMNKSLYNQCPFVTGEVLYLYGFVPKKRKKSNTIDYYITDFEVA